jgi:hypothetical protein
MPEYYILAKSTLNQTINMPKFLFTDWTREEKALLKTLNSPIRIQTFLDHTEYNGTKETRSACLENIGYKPLVLDLQAYNDDDHVIAIFKVKGCWGALAKSNFTTLRYREPVYRTLRELSMSYFDFYFNLNGEKSLRGFSLPHNLQRFDNMNWRTTEKDVEDIGYFLDKVKHFPLVNSAQIRKLEIAGDYLMKSSLMGSNPEGLFVPSKKN